MYILNENEICKGYHKSADWIENYTKIADMGQPVEQNKISGFSVPDERWTNKIQNVER